MNLVAAEVDHLGCALVDPGCVCLCMAYPIRSERRAALRSMAMRQAHADRGRDAPAWDMVLRSFAQESGWDMVEGFA